MYSGIYDEVKQERIRDRSHINKPLPIIGLLALILKSTSITPSSSKIDKMKGVIRR